jgi:hypothetical protein
MTFYSPELLPVPTTVIGQYSIFRVFHWTHSLDSNSLDFHCSFLMMTYMVYVGLLLATRFFFLLPPSVYHHHISPHGPTPIGAFMVLVGCWWLLRNQGGKDLLFLVRTHRSIGRRILLRVLPPVFLSMWGWSLTTGLALPSLLLALYTLYSLFLRCTTLP